ncbi:MAG: hypothetical protein AB1627_13880 [Chloroflexota bacterium]
MRAIVESIDDTPPVCISGEIDRLAGGGIEVLGYKAGSARSQKGVHANLQRTRRPFGRRGSSAPPERVTLYYTEPGSQMSSTRTDEQLDLAREELLARVRPIRAGEFTATPGRLASGVTIGRCARSRRDARSPAEDAPRP